MCKYLLYLGFFVYTSILFKSMYVIISIFVSYIYIHKIASILHTHNFTVYMHIHICVYIFVMFFLNSDPDVDIAQFA